MTISAALLHIRTINCQNEGFAQNKPQMAEGNFVRRRFDALPDELQHF